MKLFHKIAVTTLGIVMATAVGAGVAHYNRGDIRAAGAAYEATALSSLKNGDVVHIAYNINSDVYEVTGAGGTSSAPYLAVTKQTAGFIGSYPLAVTKQNNKY